MYKSFADLLNTVLRHWSKNGLPPVLSSLGITLAVATGFSIFFNYYKAKALAGLDTLGPVTGLLALAGVDVAISVMIGARLGAAYLAFATDPIRVIRG